MATQLRVGYNVSTPYYTPKAPTPVPTPSLFNPRGGVPTLQPNFTSGGGAGGAGGGGGAGGPVPTPVPTPKPLVNSPVPTSQNLVNTNTASGGSGGGAGPLSGAANFTNAFNGQAPQINTAFTDQALQAQRERENIAAEEARRQEQDLLLKLNSEYEQLSNNLNAQEQSLKAQEQAAIASANAGAAPTRTAIGNERTSRNADLTTQAQNEQSRAKTAISQAQQLYRDTQQQNSAQLSALGISSSSVTEALAERLGRDTAQRIGGTTNDLNQVLGNIDSERTRTNDFYNQKLTDLEGQLQATIGNIQAQSLQALNQLQLTRGQSANDLAGRRLDILQQTRAQINSAKDQTLAFQQQLDQFNAQRQAALDDARQMTLAELQKPQYLQYPGGLVQLNQLTGETRSIGLPQGILKSPTSGSGGTDLTALTNFLTGGQSAPAGVSQSVNQSTGYNPNLVDQALLQGLEGSATSDDPNNLLGPAALGSTPQQVRALTGR